MLAAEVKNFQNNRPAPIVVHQKIMLEKYEKAKTENRILSLDVNEGNGREPENYYYLTGKIVSINGKIFLSISGNEL